MYTEGLVYNVFDSRQEELTMLECIRHRAKSTGEANTKLYDEQNACQTGKTAKESPKAEKEK